MRVQRQCAAVFSFSCVNFLCVSSLASRKKTPVRISKDVSSDFATCFGRSATICTEGVCMLAETSIQKHNEQVLWGEGLTRQQDSSTFTVGPRQYHCSLENQQAVLQIARLSQRIESETAMSLDLCKLVSPPLTAEWRFEHTHLLARACGRCTGADAGRWLQQHGG